MRLIRARRSRIATVVCAASLIVTAGTLTFIPGCESMRPRPSPQAILDDYDFLKKEIDNWKDDALKACEQTSNPQTCKDGVIARWMDMRDNLIKWKQKKSDGADDDAKKAWDDFWNVFKGLVPNFKDIIDLLNSKHPNLKLGMMMPTTPELDTNGRPNIFIFAGTVHVSETSDQNQSFTPSDVALTIKGYVNISCDTNVALPAVQGKVYAGVISAETSDGIIFTVEIAGDSMNVLTINASGSGTLTMVGNVTCSLPGWGAMIPPTRLRLPVQRQEDGSYLINVPTTSARDLMPIILTGLSDANGDGVRDSNDLAAFTAALAAHADWTDLTGDGVYDADDLAAWMDLYDHDTGAHGGILP